MRAKFFRVSLVGAAAILTASADARAAEPVEYVRVCSLYGAGFYYIPGTDTCIKIGGYVRAQYEMNSVYGGFTIGTGVHADRARQTRDEATNDGFVRATATFDVRTQTEYGTLRSYSRLTFQHSTLDTGSALFADRAFIQFAGFTFGRTQSFFDTFSYAGAYSYHYPRIGAETGEFGAFVIGYTAQLGSGVSASIAIEDPNNHYPNPVIDGSTAAWAINASVPGDKRPNSGPDITGNLRIDQAWGQLAVSGALHKVSGAYYGTPNRVDRPFPDDRWGWAFGAGGKFNLPWGDTIGANYNYSVGAVGFATALTGGIQIYDNNDSVGVGWLTDGIFDDLGGVRRQIELTRAWSVLGAYERMWTPNLRTSVFGGYVKVDYNAAATEMINAHLPGAAGTRPCGVPVAGAVWPPITINPGNSCNPDFSYYEVGTRTEWNPTPQLSLGVQVLYTHLNTAYKGSGVYPQNLPRPQMFRLDDQDILSIVFRAQRNFWP